MTREELEFYEELKHNRELNEYAFDQLFILINNEPFAKPNVAFKLINRNFPFIYQGQLNLNLEEVNKKSSHFDKTSMPPNFMNEVENPMEKKIIVLPLDVNKKGQFNDLYYLKNDLLNVGFSSKALKEITREERNFLKSGNGIIFNCEMNPFTSNKEIYDSQKKSWLTDRFFESEDFNLIFNYKINNQESSEDSLTLKMSREAFTFLKNTNDTQINKLAKSINAFMESKPDFNYSNSVIQKTIKDEINYHKQDDENSNKKVISAFKKNKITEIYYQTKCPDGKVVTVNVYLNRNTLWYEKTTTKSALAETNLNLTDDPFVVYKKNGKWEKSELPLDLFLPSISCQDGKQLSLDDQKEFEKKIIPFLEFSSKSTAFKTAYLIKNKTDEVLNNPFYKEVKIEVKTIVQNTVEPRSSKPVFETIQQTIKIPKEAETSSSKNFDENEKADITIEIHIDDKGKPTIKNIVSPNYLKEFEDKWKTEAKRRGLEVNIPALRKQVHTDLENIAKENEELSFYKKFVQGTKALLYDNIASYVEGIAATQKIAKNVWAQGTINESTWHKKDFVTENKLWPKYCQFQPVVGGVQDGVIDEIVGIPMAIKGVYEIVTDDKKQDALKGMFTKEGMGKLYEGLKTEAKETLNDTEKGEHFAGQTTVSVVSMMSGVGLFTKADKLVDGLDNITDAAQVVTNPKALKAIDEIKGETKYLPENKAEIPEFLENRKATEDFLKNADLEILDELGEDLSKIVGKGEDFTVLQKARNLPGVSSGKGKEIKGKWLKGKDGNAALFPKSVADKLSGKKFANFDEFRKEFWKTVAEDEKLVKQFDKQSITRMENGLSPFVRNTQNLGGQKNYVLHHKTPINQGGAVFDMDNLIIVTPRFHKEVLAPAYHYGYGY